MDTKVKDQLQASLPDAICCDCRGEGQREYDFEGYAQRTDCSNCEGTGIEQGYEDEVKQLLISLYGEKHEQEFSNFLNQLK